MAVTIVRGGGMSVAPSAIIGPGAPKPFQNIRPSSGGPGGGSSSNNQAAQQQAIAEKAAQEKLAAENKAKQEAAAKAEQQRQQLAQQQKENAFAAQQEQSKIQQLRSSIVGSYTKTKEYVKTNAPPALERTNRFVTEKTGLNIQQGATRVKETFAPVVDVVSGRILSVNKQNKEQQKLNKQVEEFNVQYGNRELSESEFKSASAKAESLEARQKKIDADLKKIEGSVSFKVGDILYGRSIERAATEQGGTLFAGSLPIVPASSVPSKMTGLRFAGTQTQTPAGLSLTTLKFTTTTGRTGVAQAVSKGDELISKSFIGSGSTSKAIKFPSGNIVNIKPTSSIGLEKSISKPLLAEDLTGQISTGRALTVKGYKPPIAGKGKPTDYISVAVSKTDNDITKVIGRSLTREGAKAQFGGFIKKIETPKIFEFSGGRVGTISKPSTKVVEELLGSVGATEARETGASSFKAISSSVSIPKVTTQKAETSANLQFSKVSSPTKQEISSLNKATQLPKLTSQTSTRTGVRTVSAFISNTRQETKQIPKSLTLQSNLQSTSTRQLQRQFNVNQSKSLSRLGLTSFVPFAKPIKGLRGFTIPKGIGGGSRRGIFGVQVRRGGVFRNVGTTRTLQGALNLGRSKASTTLARSFRLTGGSVKGLGLPAGFRRSKREKNVFVEKSKFALNTGSELNEIAGFNRSKPRRRKK